MKNLILYSLLIILFGEILYLIKINTDKPQEKVLAEAIVYATPSASPKPTPKPTQIPSASPKPIATAAQPIFTSQEINGHIDMFAGQYGVDPNVIRHLAICESSFNPTAIQGKYVGLFQFDITTWQKYRRKMNKDINDALRANAKEAIETAAYAISLGNLGIWPNCDP